MALPSVALVHDYLTQRGGAERVVLSMLEAFPGAPLYTSVYDPLATLSEFRQHDIRTLFPNRIGRIKDDHRWGLPLYPAAFSRLNIEADVVICSSSGFAHGARARSGRKLVYCYTPARWLYDHADHYLASWPGPVRTGIRCAGPLLRRWDRRAMRDASQLLTSSTAMSASIGRIYRRRATVLPPPNVLDPNGEQTSLDLRPQRFVLSVGRLLSYKNVDKVIAAATQLPDVSFLVVGDGPDRARLKRDAGPNVTFAGQISESQLRWSYRNAIALVSASYEDYGLTPLEAASFGTPAVVLRRGGFVDTVLEGTTGVFFDSPDPVQIANSIRLCMATSWNEQRIRTHALRYSEEAFAQGLRTAVNGLMTERMPVEN
ncbi:MAG: glycosyltransferase [Roseovarius sp.]|jgi:glycosyltransferase involved in cell wall biosynthesis|nr:glycosyltransferase [Roseovarius sp.]